MINLEIIEKEILDLERRDTSYATVERLAWLYIVKDHITAPSAAEVTGSLIGNEFIQACSNVPIQALLEILNEIMDNIKLLYPKEYDRIIAKIEGLKSTL